MVRFQCQQCRREIEVAETPAGPGATCPQCGAAVVAPPTVAPVVSAAPVAAEPARTSGWAIASFVCGLVECVGGIPSILALIFGLVAIRQINRSGGRLKGLWMAIVGLVLGGLFLLAMPLIIAVSLPAMMAERDKANRMVDASHLQSIGAALAVYAANNNGHYPTVYSNPQAEGEQWGPGFDPKTGLIADAAAPSGPGAVHGPYTCNLSCLYLLVRQGLIKPEVFVCPTDPNGEKLTDPMAKELWSFQNIKQCSYSFQNQLGLNTNQATLDPQMIVAADASPLRPGTEIPTDAFLPWNHNSPLFKYTGQNCLYADGHVEWQTTPDCGYGGNNIWARSTFNESMPDMPAIWSDASISTTPPTATIGHKYDSFLVP